MKTLDFKKVHISKDSITVLDVSHTIGQWSLPLLHVKLFESIERLQHHKSSGLKSDQEIIDLSAVSPRKLPVSI